MQSLLPKMRLMRRISFLSRPVSGTLLSRPVQLGLARCHLSSSVILHKEPPKGFGNFGSKTPDKGSKKSGRKRRESRKETATEPGIYPKIIPFSNPQNLSVRTWCPRMSNRQVMQESFDWPFEGNYVMITSYFAQPKWHVRQQLKYQ